MAFRTRCRATLGIAVLVLAMLAPTPILAADGCLSTASSVAPIERVSGPDRYATAACVSQTMYPNGTAHVLLARGDQRGGLADALAGAVLARAVDGPVLLTSPDALLTVTEAELRRLEPSRVTILGGTAAVSEDVEAAVRAIGGINVDRVSGGHRAQTAVAVAQSAQAGTTAFIVNGTRPADSLVAAAPAARSHSALLLVEQNAIPQTTRQALQGKTQAVIVGGYGVVSESVERQLRTLVGADRVRRVAGADRSETAAAVARAFPASGRRHLVSGRDANLVDAVTAGWAAAMPGGGPVLYSERDRPGRSTDRYLRLGGLRPTGSSNATTRLVGGTAALSNSLARVLETRYSEAAQGGPAPELRGVWVHLFDSTLKSRQNIYRMLDDASAAGLNTVIVEVVRRQDAYYESDVLPRTVDPALPADLDVLEHLIPAAHDRGLQVHAWVPVMPAYHGAYNGLTLPPGHVYREHGPNSSEPWTTRSYTGGNSTYLDPGVPRVQDHVATIMGELADRYPVDAVHIDYLRYDGKDWGYHPKSLSRFRAQTGATGTPAPTNAAWGTWRRAQTHDLARRILLEVIDADPGVAVSLAGSTMGASPSSAGGYTKTRTYSDVFQDWPMWLRTGVIDAAFPMYYFRHHDATQRAWYNEWVAYGSEISRGSRTLAIGQASYLNSVAGSLAQIRDARESTNGVVLYSYQQTTDSGDTKALLGSVASSAFAEPAPAPRMPARPSNVGYLIARAADGADIQIARVGGGGGPTTVRADGTSRAGFLNLAPGDWNVSAPGFATARVAVRAGEVTRINLQRSP